ncbi:MAG: nucleotidyltransferase family protein [bacterium]
MEVKEIIKQCYKIIKKYLPNSKVILFGSFSKGKALNYSDIDLAIDNFEKIDYKVINKIRDEIEELKTLRSIDIVDINNASSELKESILKEGIILNENS